MHERGILKTLIRYVVWRIPVGSPGRRVRARPREQQRRRAARHDAQRPLVGDEVVVNRLDRSAMVTRASDSKS